MHIVKRLMRRIFVGSATLYSMSITVLATLWWLAPQASWWIALSNVFAALFFLPLLLLIPAALVVRSRWVYIMTAVPAGIFVLMFGSLFVPRLPAAMAAGSTIRVATFNQLYRGANVEGLIAAIRKQDADVVALQELHPSVATVLQRDLTSIYPYQVLSPVDGPGGLGLLSRHPITGWDPDGGGAGPIAVEVNGQQIVIMNVHIHFSGISKVRSQRFLGLPYMRMYDMQGRTAQVENLLQRVATFNGPLIMMGDFNTGDREPGYAILAAQFRDVFRETSSGFGFTFPNNKRMGPITVPVPLVRIDYIWARGPITPLASYVECDNGGSDHCMVVADLRIVS